MSTQAEHRCPQCGKSFAPTVRICPDDGTVLEHTRTGDEHMGAILDGKYRLDGLLSQGGMGSVFKATHVMLQKTVAVKLINPEIVTSPEIVRRFQREARAATTLSHPNITSVYDLGQTPEGTLYIAMEFIDGPTLKAVLKSGGAMPAARIVPILRQVASALALAHRKGIVHRDLKPQNIMLVKDDHGRDVVKLVDFGIAKTFDEATQLTQTGFAIGTPQYMAPEQAEGKPVDGRSDIYSLGVILYEMLSGEVPFTGESTPVILIKHIKETPALPSLRNPGAHVSPALEAIAMRCLEKEPAQRFQTVEEFSTALDGVDVGAGTGAATAPMAAAAPAAWNFATEAAALAPTLAAPAGTPTPGAQTRIQDLPAAASAAAATAPPPVAARSQGAAAMPGTAATPPSKAPLVIVLCGVVLVGGAAAWFMYGGGAAMFGPRAAESTAAAAAAPSADQTPAAVPTPQPDPAATPGAAAATPPGTDALAASTPAPPGSSPSPQPPLSSPSADTAAAAASGGPAPATGAAAGGNAGAAPSSPRAGRAAASGPSSPAPASPPGPTDVPPPAQAAPPPSRPSAPPPPAPPAGRAPVRAAGTAPPSASARSGERAVRSRPAPAGTGAVAAEEAPAPSRAPSSPAGAAGGAPAAARQPSAIAAGAAVAFQCGGANEVCTALRSAVDNALQKAGFTSLRNPGRADVLVDATVTPVDERVSRDFGTTFAVRSYTIDVSAETTRGGEAVPMPSPETLSYDPKFGSERVTEKARVVAAGIVEKLKKARQ